MEFRGVYNEHINNVRNLIYTSLDIHRISTRYLDVKKFHSKINNLMVINITIHLKTVLHRNPDFYFIRYSSSLNSLFGSEKNVSQ